MTEEEYELEIERLNNDLDGANIIIIIGMVLFLVMLVLVIALTVSGKLFLC